MGFWQSIAHHINQSAQIPICKVETIDSATSSTDQIPTFFVHGFRGGNYTTQEMVKSAQIVTHSPVFLRATVDWNSKIHYSGYWSTAKYPLVQLVFKDRWIPTNTIERWVNQIINDLSQRYHFQTYNAVGHSLGAVALVNFLINSCKRPLPPINRLVLIAGPFDGVVALGDLPNINPLAANGKPAFMTPRYLWTYLNRSKFPATAHVLNVYGNINDSSNTDKYVSVSSARSIKYILQTQVQEFSEYRATGSSGEHSKMHDDSQVLKQMNQFLFPQLAASLPLKK